MNYMKKSCFICALYYSIILPTVGATTTSEKASVFPFSSLIMILWYYLL